jgi:hypothetical protein
VTLKHVFRRIASARTLVIIVLLGALALGVFWFLRNYEKKPIEVHRGIYPAALKNPLLAAERYLQATGKEAVSRDDLDFFKVLPSPEDAIVIRHLPRGLGKTTNDRIMNWVEAGGQLLLIPGSPSGHSPGQDDLLARIGVQLQKTGEDSDCGCPDEADKQEQNQDTHGNDPQTDSIEEDIPVEPSDSVITLQFDTFPVRLRYNYYSLLEDLGKKADFRINGSHRLIYPDDSDTAQPGGESTVREEADWLLEYTIGAGKITVLSDMSVFFNDAIGDYDHAFLFSWLLRERPRVWLLYAANARPLSAILWNRSPLFWSSLLVLLILVIWRMQKQSGTLLRPDGQAQRNLLAHLDGSGQYGWRLDSSAAMIEDNRKALLAAWTKRKSGCNPAGDSRNFDLAALADRTGITAEELDAAMTLKVNSEQDLIRTSRAMQRVQMRLHNEKSTHYDR